MRLAPFFSSDVSVVEGDTVPSIAAWPSRRRCAAVLAAAAMAACSPPAPPPPPPAAPLPSPPPSAPPPAAEPPALTVAAAFDQICNGPSSIPLEIAGSREFVSLPLAGPKGTETLRFHVDTGGNTPGLMIRRSVAERLGFASEDALPKVVRLGDHDVALPEGARWIILDDTSDEARKRPTAEHAIRKGFAAGQLGAGFLSRFVLCIDPARGRMGLGDPRTVRIDAAGTPGIPVIMLPGGENHALYPFVQIHIRHEGTLIGGYGMLLDTGATTTMIEERKIRYLKDKAPAWPLATGAAGDADMIGGLFPEAMLRAAEVVITAPSAKFPGRPEVAAGPVVFVARGNGTFTKMFGDAPYTGGSHGALANEVLLRFRLLLDYRAERLWLEPVTRPLDRSASMTRVGLALRFGDDGCPVIQQITDTNAPATLAALKVGDVLLAVGDRDACKAWHHEIQAELSGAVGEPKKLRIRRNGAVQDVVVPVAALLP
jgi:hypothetical protein